MSATAGRELIRQMTFVVAAILILTAGSAAAQQRGKDGGHAIELIAEKGSSIGAALLFADVMETALYAANMPSGEADRFVSANLRFPEPGDYLMVIDFFSVEGIDTHRRTTGWLDHVDVTGPCGSNRVLDQGGGALINLDCPGEVSFVYRTNTRYVVVLVSYAPDTP